MPRKPPEHAKPIAFAVLRPNFDRVHHGKSRKLHFCKIIAGTVPCQKVYEDEEVFGFKDINPAAPIHFLLIPKRHITTLEADAPLDAQLLGRMMALVPRLAVEQGCRPGREGGFRLSLNNGVDGGQEVYHTHLHVMGGPRPWNK